MRHQCKGQVSGRVDADGVGHNVGGDRSHAICPPHPFGRCRITLDVGANTFGSEYWIRRIITRLVAKSDDQFAIEIGGVTKQAIVADQLDAGGTGVGSQRVGQFGVAPGSPGQECVAARCRSITPIRPVGDAAAYVGPVYQRRVSRLRIPLPL